MIGIESVPPYPRAVERFPTVRQSTLAAFDACALSSHLENEYLRGVTYHHQGRGRLFHSFAAKALNEMRDHGEERIEVDVALAILDEVVGQDDADRTCPHCGGEKILPGLSKFMERTCGECGGRFETEFVNVPRKHLADLVWIVKKWAKDNTFDTAHIVDVEKRLTAIARYSQHGLSVERVLTGQLDVLLADPLDGTHAIVIDWKDTWGLPAVSTISEGGFFQQRFYAWLVMHTYKTVERVTLREFYVRRPETREATLWRMDLDQLDAEFSALVRKFDRSYEEQVFRPSPGAHCSWCPRPLKCPVPKWARTPGEITSDRMAKQMAAQLLVAKQGVKVAENALRTYVDKTGEPVEVKYAKGKRVYGFVEQKRVDRPTREQIEDAMLERGGALSNADLDRLYRDGRSTRFIDHAPPARQEGADKSLIDSLAGALDRAAKRKGVA